MNYICMKCKKTINSEKITKRIRCPLCGSKILIKKTENIIRKVKAL